MNHNQLFARGLRPIFFLLYTTIMLVGCGGYTAVPAASEPIIPTVTPQPPALEAVIEPTIRPTATPIPATVEPTATVVIEATLEPTKAPVSLKDSEDFARFGLSGLPEQAQVAIDIGLPFSIYMDWLNWTTPNMPAGVTYWQMVRTHENQLRPNVSKIREIVEANPGAVWLIGNEPDVIWQDNVSAEIYATLYQQAYTEIKAIDPSAIVSPGGIAQATPLRLQYLDRVLAAYQAEFNEPLPADMWNIHAYVLREERDSWGVSIPPGMDDINIGELYEIEDHDNLTILTEGIIRFRQWMADNGYQETPLAITEFGILLPHDYGFPPEVIAQYMRDSFDIFLSLNNETGLSADNNKLLQHWVWYILEESEERYPYSNLINSSTNSLTLIGEAYRDYLLEPR